MLPAHAAWTPGRLVARLEGDEALARELMGLFLQEYAHLLQALQAAAESGSADRVRTAAHALKGCIGNFTDDGAFITTFEIEHRATAGMLDDVPTLLRGLAGELEALASRMRQYAGAA